MSNYIGHDYRESQRRRQLEEMEYQRSVYGIGRITPVYRDASVVDGSMVYSVPVPIPVNKENKKLLLIK